MNSRGGLSLSPSARSWILGALLFYAAAELLARWNLRALLSCAGNVIAVALLLIASWGQGLCLVARLRVTLDRWERALFSITLGLGLISIEVFILGIAGLWSRPCLTAFLALALLPAWPAFLRERGMNGGIPLAPPSWAPLLIVPHFLTFLAALMPPVYYDSLVYHCGLPNMFLQEGRWIPVPGNVFASYPQVMEMNFLLLMGTGAASGPCLLVWTMSILSVIAVIAFARRFVDEGVGWTAAALVSVTPFWLLLASDAYVDIPLACCTFLSLFAFCLFDRNETSYGSEWLCGLSAGFTFGIKYTGAALVILLAVGWVARRRVVRFSLGAFLAAAPWFVRNIWMTGNPVFPFFSDAMSDPALKSEASLYFLRMLSEYGDTWTNLRAILVIPIELALEKEKFGGGFDLLGNFGWGLPLALLLIWPLQPIRHRLSRPLFLLFAGFYVVWVMTKPVSRFLVPAFPLLAVLSAWGLCVWTRAAHGAGRGMVFLPILLLFFSNIHSFALITRQSGKLEAAISLEPADAYLGRKLDYHEAAKFTGNLPDNARIHVLGDQRAHYIERPFQAVPVYSNQPLVANLNDPDDEEKGIRYLRSGGFTHLLVNDAEWRRLQSYETLTLTETGAMRWERLQANELELVYQDRACRLWKLK
ncbi:MAG: glycosyltransferase family 39 protein [Candidatus Hydrogenedentota bacterium]